MLGLMVFDSQSFVGVVVAGNTRRMSHELAPDAEVLVGLHCNAKEGVDDVPAPSETLQASPWPLKFDSLHDDCLQCDEGSVRGIGR